MKNILKLNNRRFTTVSDNTVCNTNASVKQTQTTVVMCIRKLCVSEACLEVWNCYWKRGAPEAVCMFV